MNIHTQSGINDSLLLRYVPERVLSSTNTKTMTGEQLIGRARERWEEIDNEGLDWKSFANGWLEGRIDRMKQLDKEVWDALNEQWGLTNKLDKKVWNDD